jgi:4-hydroxybutyrate CoA-transferase
MVIAEVWEDAPVVYGGDNHVHVDHLDYLVPSQAIPWPPPQLEAMLVTPAEEVGPFEVIGAYLAEEIIDDGDTLMTGAGADRYESMLMNKVDLGCHCETVPPMDLIMAGVVTNKRRNFCTGKTSLTSITTMRTPEQRKFVNDNPHLFDIRLVEKINNPVYLAQNDNLVGVNTCVEIDLKSHISVERVGYRMFHGVGGQFELIQGCLLSRGGRSCHCVLSTKAHGTVSTIVPELTPKSLATINPATADFVITEYGIASLMGRTERERANELIAVAHPDFRPWLRGEAKKMFG